MPLNCEGSWSRQRRKQVLIVGVTGVCQKGADKFPVDESAGAGAGHMTNDLLQMQELSRSFS